MELNSIIQQLKDIRASFPLTDEQREGIDKAISKLENSSTKEHIIEAIKILAALLGAGSKFLDP